MGLKKSKVDTMMYALSNKFIEFKLKLGVFITLQPKQKLIKDKKTNILFMDKNDFFQFLRRWLKRESRKKTLNHITILFKDYLDFLDEVKLYIRGKELFCKEYKFARQINIFNESIIDGLFNLRVTYSNSNSICSKVGGFILHLNDFRNETIYFTKCPRRSHSF